MAQPVHSRHLIGADKAGREAEAHMMSTVSQAVGLREIAGLLPPPPRSLRKPQSGCSAWLQIRLASSKKPETSMPFCFGQFNQGPWEKLVLKHLNLSRIQARAKAFA